MPDAFLKTVVEKKKTRQHGCFGKNFICILQFIFVSGLLLQIFGAMEKSGFYGAGSPAGNRLLGGAGHFGLPISPRELLTNHKNGAFVKMLSLPEVPGGGPRSRSFRGLPLCPLLLQPGETCWQLQRSEGSRKGQEHTLSLPPGTSASAGVCCGRKPRAKRTRSAQGQTAAPASWAGGSLRGPGWVLGEVGQC